VRLQLREPSLELAASFEEMRDAYLRADEDPWRGRHALAHSDIPAWIRVLNRRAQGEEIPEGWVPETQYWVLMENAVVGDVELRHPLNERLRQNGGNIGYGVHPSHRGKGIATFALREGLKILAEMNLSEALATCRDDNAPSIRVLEKCGGIRIEDSNGPGPLRRRYKFLLVDVPSGE
jgi:predicted acetyltransferase